MRLAAAVLCALAACAAADRDPKWRPAGSATPRDGGTLRFAVATPILTLDPTLASTDEVTAYAAHALFATLVAIAPSGQIVPDLAERWALSDDRLVYTFTLRAGLVYSDGTPVAAADVRAELEHALRTPGASAAQMLADVVGAADVASGAAPHAAGLAAPDARTLVIRLARPNATLLGVLAMSFASPQPEGRAPDRAAPLGTGPFVLAAWHEGERIALRKNPRYWDAAHIHLAGIDVRESVPVELQFLMFERGELDTVASLAAPDALWIQAQPAWQPYLRRSAQVAVFGARMNVRVAPFTDVRVRQAFNYALDKGHAIKLLHGTATIAHGPLPPGIPGRDDALAPYPHDPAKARALLAAAGFPAGFDVDYEVPALDDFVRLAASLAADLGEVGVRVHIRAVAPATWEADLASPTGAPFAMASWLFDYPDPAAVFDAQFATTAIGSAESTNYAFYGSAELDALLDAARGEPDAGARAALYRRAERIVYEDAPWLWGFHYELVEVVQPYVMGYVPDPMWPRDFTHAWLDLGADGEPVPR